MPPRIPAGRIHLIPAREAPFVAVIRRKPAAWVHISRLNTDTGVIEHGGWYYGRIYERNCDVSFDGAWWVFGAYGRYDDIVEIEQARHKRAWTGVARLPGFDLAQIHPDITTIGLGGFFAGSSCLFASAYPESHHLREVPFETNPSRTNQFGFDDRMKREGWERVGPRPQWVCRERPRKRRTLPHVDYVIPDDPGWLSKSPDHRLTLRMFERGLFPRSTGVTAEFRIDEAPDFLDEHVTWACFDKDGRLLVARSGRVELYASSDDVFRNEPSFVHDLEDLMPPSKGTES